MLTGHAWHVCPMVYAIPKNPALHWHDPIVACFEAGVLALAMQLVGFELFNGQYALIGQSRHVAPAVPV